MKRTITFIQVGSPAWAPTGEELQKIIQDFQSHHIYIAKVGVAVSTLDIDPEKQHLVLRSQKLSETELEAIKAQFDAAIQDPNGGIVATLHTVHASVLDTGGPGVYKKPGWLRTFWAYLCMSEPKKVKVLPVTGPAVITNIKPPPPAADTVTKQQVDIAAQPKPAPPAKKKPVPVVPQENLLHGKPADKKAKPPVTEDKKVAIDPAIDLMHGKRPVVKKETEEFFQKTDEFFKQQAAALGKKDK